eukprot:COSAG03_NODE_8304_length_815_cov_1.650838_1_plen_149_part_10
MAFARRPAGRPATRTTTVSSLVDLRSQRTGRCVCVYARARVCFVCVSLSLALSLSVSVSLCLSVSLSLSLSRALSLSLLSLLSLSSLIAAYMRTGRNAAECGEDVAAAAAASALERPGSAPANVTVDRLFATGVCAFARGQIAEAEAAF